MAIGLLCFFLIEEVSEMTKPSNLERAKVIYFNSFEKGR